VLLETVALVQRRLGMAAVRTLLEQMMPVVALHWVSPDQHRQGVAAFLAAGQRRYSLVDAVSFVAMRELGTQQAFAYDDDFRRQGFEPV
jgi:uncharacterized protein